jgi:hypothetical protein
VSKDETPPPLLPVSLLTLFDDPPGRKDAGSADVVWPMGLERTLLLWLAIVVALGAMSIAAGRALEGPLDARLARRPDAAQLRKLEDDTGSADRGGRAVRAVRAQGIAR